MIDDNKEKETILSDYEVLMRVIKERRSIRSFKNEMPGKDVLAKLLDAARYAPSATNFQPWFFIVLSDKNKKEKMVEAVLDKINTFKISTENVDFQGDTDSSLNAKEFSVKYFLFFKDAPVLVLVLYKPYPDTTIVVKQTSSAEELSNARHTVSIMSTSAAIQNFLLAAHSLGLGACWLDGPLIAKKEIEVIFNIKSPWSIMSIIALGYPADVPPPQRRKNIELISKFIQ